MLPKKSQHNMFRIVFHPIMLKNQTVSSHARNSNPVIKNCGHSHMISYSYNSMEINSSNFLNLTSCIQVKREKSSHQKGH